MKGNSSSYVLGISCHYHDAAAALLMDGEILAAAAEERFTRKKHDSSYPEKAIEYCLKEANIEPTQLSCVVFYEKPILKFERILSSFISTWPTEFWSFYQAMRSWLGEKIWIKSLIRKKLSYSGPIYFSEHHISHAASAFLVSPFERAAILTVDGVGEWATASFGSGFGNKIEIMKEVDYPNSLGLLYSSVTYFLGFKPNSDEYKIMGLAPYGSPRYLDRLRVLLRQDNGGIIANSSLRNYSWRDVEKTLKELLGFEKREQSDPLDESHKDLAASIQALTIEIMLGLAQKLHEDTGEDNLCMAGGVALNCVANSEILKHSGFKNIFIQPASGDDGGALGAGLYIWHQIMENPRRFQMEHTFFGPQFNDDEIKVALDSRKYVYKKLGEKALLNEVARLLSQQKVVGWFQGRMEWGPRALGNRSILADPRNPENWQRVNMKIKFRESFRPFAPVILKERASRYFDLKGASPYMLFTAPVKSKRLPAVTHVDNSARLQTLEERFNPKFYRLISTFDKLTGCPAVINTSFNTRGEPIACTPEDALDTFEKTNMDILAIGSYLIKK